MSMTREQILQMHNITSFPAMTEHHSRSAATAQLGFDQLLASGDSRRACA